MAKASTTPVEVTLELGDDTYVLVPTLSAIRKINRHFGGLDSALNRLRVMDFEAAAYVLSVGADVKGRDADALAGKLYRSGLIEATPPLVEYVAILLNGGKRLDDGDQPEPSGADEGNG